MESMKQSYKVALYCLHYTDEELRFRHPVELLFGYIGG